MADQLKSTMERSISNSKQTPQVVFDKKPPDTLIPKMLNFTLMDVDPIEVINYIIYHLIIFIDFFYFFLILSTFILFNIIYFVQNIKFYLFIFYYYFYYIFIVVNIFIFVEYFINLIFLIILYS